MQAMFSSGAAQTNRLWSPGIWGDMTRPDGLNFEARIKHDDFVTKGPVASNVTTVGAATVNSNYGVYLSPSATMTDAAIDGGVLALTTAAADNMSIALQGTVGGGIVGKAYGDSCFEARIKVSSIAATTFSLFVGLMDAGTAAADEVPVTAADALANKDLIGFFRSAGGATMDTVYKKTGQTAVTVGSAVVTLVADTFIKLGFRFRQAEQRLRYYVNGIELADKVSASATTGIGGTRFPTLTLVPVIAMMSAVGTSYVTYLDWWTVGQKEIS